MKKIYLKWNNSLIKWNDEFLKYEGPNFDPYPPLYNNILYYWTLDESLEESFSKDPCVGLSWDGYPFPPISDASYSTPGPGTSTHALKTISEQSGDYLITQENLIKCGGPGLTGTVWTNIDYFNTDPIPSLGIQMVPVGINMQGYNPYYYGFMFYGSGPGGGDVDVLIDINHNDLAKWNQLAFSHDRVSNKVRIYYNGDFIKTADVSGGVTGSENWWGVIGLDPSEDGYGVALKKCRVSNIALYDRVLSDEEIEQIFFYENRTLNTTDGSISYLGEDTIITFKNTGHFGWFNDQQRDASILIVGGGGNTTPGSLNRSAGAGGGEVIQLNATLMPGIYNIFVGEATRFSGFATYKANAGKNNDNWTGGISGSGLAGGESGYSFSAGGGAGDTSTGKKGTVYPNTPYTGGYGGAGEVSYILGTAIEFGGGGGGTGGASGGVAGLGRGGGGNGGYNAVTGTDGSANTGGGAGGCYGYTGRTGGSGIVIIRYKT